MRARAGVLLLTAVLALAGCAKQPAPPISGGPSNSVGPSVLPTTAATTAPPSSGVPATEADLETYIKAGTAVSPSAYADSVNALASFSTPSGNISCGFPLVGPWVMCWINQNSWPSVPPVSCKIGDWNPTWVTASSDGVKRGACTSEQPFPMPGKVLPYGSTISSGPVTCRSESAFLACAHVGVAGFAIAKTIYQTYGPVVA